MKKKFFFFWTLTLAIAICTGCGSNKDTAKMMTTSGEIVDADQAPEVETGSKTIVSNQSENDVVNVETLEAPTATPQEDNIPLATPAIPEEPLQHPEQYDEEAICYSTGNFEDYWLGEDYFDLVPYMEDNGFKVIGLNELSEPIEVGETPNSYFCDYNDRWGIYIGSNGWCVQDFSIGIIYCAYCEEYDSRKIDIGGCTAYVDHLWALPVAVENIKNDSENPFLGLDESYTVKTY